MSSNLIKEDDEFLYLERYIHGQDDELPNWIFDKKWKWKYSEEIVMADDTAAYELLMKYRIRKSNAEVIIDSIQ